MIRGKDTGIAPKRSDQNGIALEVDVTGLPRRSAMTAADIDRALRAAIEAAAVSGARTRKLSGEALIRFLIAAEGGSLAKELHRAGINVTPAAITQWSSTL